uniref:Limiting CO2-inducible protein B/C beta carbonyic anhydrase domain-containing protein n=1 Tax=Cyanothece sp. (strain PCC 7425 / ATCC 29141) TaxID=395961 RepID=B8HXE3_CYAP4
MEKPITDPMQSNISGADASYSPSNNPLFYETLQAKFPGALPLSEYLQQTRAALEPYGFDDQNTMGMVLACRDEITEPLLHGVIEHWGKTFNCCSLGGFMIMGKTGLAAATHHLPLIDGVRRFVFYAMPHIAISQAGEIGIVNREGLEKSSHACGALSEIVKELSQGHLNLQTDMQDLEQSIIRQKLLSALRYGEQPDLVDITKLACRVIFSDVSQLLENLDPKLYMYAVMTGIQVHGPMDTQWIYPQEAYVMASDRHSMQLGTVSA